MNGTRLAAALGVLVATAVFSIAPTASAAGPSVPRPPRPSRAGARPASRPAPYAGEPISLDLKDADLKDVLRTFAELTKTNIAIDPDVRGSVTVRLNDVPWDQALDIILRINGLGYILEGNILRVGTPARLLSED
jgi:type IV pilus assembly protein PilQ